MERDAVEYDIDHELERATSVTKPEPASDVSRPPRSRYRKLIIFGGGAALDCGGRILLGPIVEPCLHRRRAGKWSYRSGLFNDLRQY